jgi:uncharacterized damage-inducible protein DinB
MGIPLQAFRELLAFNRWATVKLLGLTGPLSADEFKRDLGASLGSVQGTLTHMMWAEWLWVRRWRGESPDVDHFPSADYPSAEALRRRWDAVHDEQAAFARNLTARRLAGTVGYTNFAGERWEYPLWQQMAHLLNHSAYHRGQVVSLLRQLGKSATPLDVLAFYDERARVGNRA